MFSRRQFLYLTGAGALAATNTKMTGKQRVDRALNGQDVDRTPFTYWHHFGLEKLPGERLAEATLAFHRQFRTDLVKVMSDHPFPKPAGKWHDLKVANNPFPEQLRALELIREGLRGPGLLCRDRLQPMERGGKDVVAGRSAPAQTGEPQSFGDGPRNHRRIRSQPRPESGGCRRCRHLPGDRQRAGWHHDPAGLRAVQRAI
jgi:hypothetical protein